MSASTDTRAATTDAFVAPLAISVGDPAGIGPAVAVEAVLHADVASGCVLFGDPDSLARELRAMGGASVAPLRVPSKAPFRIPARSIALADCDACDAAVVSVHAPTPEGGRAQLAWLDAAIESVRAGHCRALVTGPTSKEAITRAGVEFIGQTEHLARTVGLADDAVTMMFLGERLNVALVTTHLAVRDVPAQITPPRVERTVQHLAEALRRLRPSEGDPIRITVTGLNPHAGENGLFGDEELRVVAPAVEGLRPKLRASGVLLDGPRPAETVFRDAAAGRLEGVVAMMHDQATIASKLLDWGNAVNVTWGLPFVRTSVDHGVAYDAARLREGSSEGMRAAIRMAERLTRP